MAILGNGLNGIQQGQQIAQTNFALTDLNRANTQQQLNDGIFADLVLNQRQTPAQAFATLGQTSPIPGLSLQNTGNALSLQQALLPQAFGAAQRGQFGQINQLGSLFGQPGNFNAGNLNTALPLLGAQGLSTLLQQQQQQQILGALLNGQTGFGGLGAQPLQTPTLAPQGNRVPSPTPGINQTNSTGANTTRSVR